MNDLEKAVMADLEKAAPRAEQPRSTDADAALGPLLDELSELIRRPLGCAGSNRPWATRKLP